MNLEKEREDSEVSFEDNDDRKSSFPKIVIGLFLVFLIVVMVIPRFEINNNPEPKIIIDYRLESDDSIGHFEGLYDVYSYTVSSSLKNAANKIASSGCYSGEKICQIKAIYYFVRDKIDYISDPVSKEYIQTPEATLYSGSGDCDDKSVLIVGMLKAIGVDAEIVVRPGHAYNRIYYPEAPRKYLEDEWIYVDATCSGCKFGRLDKY